MSLNINMTSDLLKTRDSLLDIDFTVLLMLSILDLKDSLLPKASYPIVAYLNSILLQVNVPVLSVKICSTYPKFSFKEHDITSTGYCLDFTNILVSQDIKRA